MFIESFLVEFSSTNTCYICSHVTAKRQSRPVKTRDIAQTKHP